MSWGDGVGFGDGYPAPASAVGGPPLALPASGPPHVDDVHEGGRYQLHVGLLEVWATP